MVPLAEIGTDPNEAQNFANRNADSGPLGKGTVSARDGLKYITQKVIDQAYADLKLSPRNSRTNGTAIATNELLATAGLQGAPAQWHLGHASLPSQRFRSKLVCTAFAGFGAP